MNSYRYKSEHNIPTSLFLFRPFYILPLFFCLVFQLLFTCSFSQLSLDSLFSLAKKSLNGGEYTTAIIHYQTCLKEAEKQKDWLKMGNAYNGIGIAYDESGNYNDGLSNYFNALKFYEHDKNEKKQAGTLKNIGNIYRMLKSYDKASEFLRLAHVKYSNSSDSTGLSGVTNDLGILYMAQDSSFKAIACFKKVISTYQKHVRKEVKAFALNNLAITYSNDSNYTEANKYYNAALIEMQKLNNQYGIALVLSNLGSMFNRWGDKAGSLEYNKQALNICKQIDSKSLLESVYKNFAETYNSLHNFKKAYEYLGMAILLRDTIFEEEKAKNYVEMETKYQNEKKQKEILQLQQENIIKNLALVNQQRTKYLLLTVLVFVLVVVVLLYRNYNIKQRTNKELNILNARLHEANHSKTKLLSIISHDLRSPLSNLFNFLQLQKRNPHRFSKEKEEEYNKQISASADNLLEAMEDLLIWAKSQMDSFQPIDEEINISHFLDDIIHLNENAAFNKNIVLVKECPENLVLTTDPNFLKVILRNLTSNAIKFTPAFGTIHLTAFKENNSLLFTVRDNGPGINSQHLQSIFDWNSIRSDSSGLGLKLAKEFTEKLKGSIVVASEVDKGTEFTLSFPC